MNRSVILLIFTLVYQVCGWPYWHHREQLRPVFVRTFFKQDSSPLPPTDAHPYQAAIILENNVFCSGALVSDQIVVTSAQCLAGADKVDVLLGARQLSDQNESTRVTIYNVTAIKIHENYDFIGSQLRPDNDIALITLPQSYSGTGISPVRLPLLSDNRTFEFYLVHASGWGKNDASEHYDLISMRENLTTSSAVAISNKECAAFYGPIINDGHLCMKAAAVSSCYGDLGSPMAVSEIDSIYTLIGVASFGSWAGCETQSPQVFTRITSFLQWMQSNGVPVNP